MSTSRYASTPQNHPLAAAATDSKLQTGAVMKSRAGRDAERFARMTDSLLQCPAVATLSHAAFRVLTILTIGARPPGPNRKKDLGRNGIQAITDTHARKFGFTSRDTVYRALHELLERGLIIKTREGHKNKTHFALYAVAWLPVTHRDGRPLDFPEPAPCGYLRWSPPKKPKKRMPNRWLPEPAPNLADRKPNLEQPSDSRTQSCPINGHDENVCRPTNASNFQNCRPIVGNTLRILGGLSIEDGPSDVS